MVTLIWADIAAVLAMMGRSAFAAAKGLPQTTDTVRRIPDALTPNPEETRRLPTMTPTRSAPKLSAPRSSLSSNVSALAYEAKRFGDQGVNVVGDGVANRANGVEGSAGVDRPMGKYRRTARSGLMGEVCYL
jgi:hypothetical protein